MSAPRRGSYLSYSKILASETVSLFTFSQKNEMRILVKMEGICMVKADSHVAQEQRNKENPKGPAFCVLEVTTIECCQLEICGE